MTKESLQAALHNARFLLETAEDGAFSPENVKPEVYEEIFRALVAVNRTLDRERQVYADLIRGLEAQRDAILWVCGLTMDEVSLKIAEAEEAAATEGLDGVTVEVG